MSVSEWSGAALPWFEELAGLKERIGGLFRRAEPRRQVGLLLEGLIGGAERKNGWQDAGAARPDDMGSREGSRHLPGLCDRASRRSIRRPGSGRDGILEEGQPILSLPKDGRGRAPIQRHGRTDRELSDRRFSRLCEPEGTCPDRPPSLSTGGLDRGRGTPEDGQHSRRGDLRHQAEDRHRHAGGGAQCRRSLRLCGGRLGLWQRQELARHARKPPSRTFSPFAAMRD